MPGDHQLVLGNLQSHLEGFLEDSDESEVFSMADRTQLEREVDACKEYYEELLRTAERGKPFSLAPRPAAPDLLKPGPC